MDLDTLYTSGMFREARDYWLTRLTAGWDELKLLRDNGETDEYEAGGGDILFTPHMSDKIMQIGKDNPLSVYVVLLALFKILLYRYTGARDIVVATATLSRSGQDYNKCIALRDRIHPSMTFKDLLISVKQTAADGFKYQYYPFARLREMPMMTHLDSATRFILVLENIHDKETVTELVEQYPNDMAVTFRERDRQLSGHILYNERLFRKATVRQLGERYVYIAAQVLADLDKSIAAIDLLGEAERRRILFEFNSREGSFPAEKTVTELFEEQVKTLPHHVAVADRDRFWTYENLNLSANGLALHLAERGVAAQSIVGIAARRSPAMIIGMIGVVKAGAAYMNVDPQDPPLRKKMMFLDSTPQVVLTSGLQGDQINGGGERFFQGTCIDLDDSGIHEERRRDPGSTGESGDPFYVIYTSGTTGRPKGVVIRQRGFVNLIYYHRSVFGENPDSRMSQVAAAGFDAASFEIWPCLSSGAGLYIAHDSIRVDPARMKQWLIRCRITISFQPTMMGERLLEEEWPERGVALKSLRVAGEKLTLPAAGSFPFRLYNLYGPSEDTVWTTWTEVNRDHVVHREPGIGKPVAHHRIYILDGGERLQPVGVGGELCISGEGVAAGYLNMPELTAEKFTNNPFERSSRLYRSGDLARWNPDGSLEFLGRADNQFKIRGFRVEPAEIESCLRRHPRIKRAAVVVMADKAGDHGIWAYFVADGKPAVPALKDYLSRLLPHYMVPAHFIPVDHIPATPNGKVDTARLPSPEVVLDTEYAAPRSEAEKTVAAIWQEELGIDRVGIDDNFFDIGGNSLKMIRLNRRLEERFGRAIDVVELFEYPTIRSFLRYLERDGSSKSSLSGNTALPEVRSRAGERRAVQKSRRLAEANEV